MSGFHVSAQLRVCSSRALSRLHALFQCWSVVFGSRDSCLEFRFRVGARTLTLHVLSLCGSVRSRVRSAAHSPVHVCFVVLHTVRVLSAAAFMLYIVLCATQLVYFIG